MNVAKGIHDSIVVHASVDEWAVFRSRLEDMYLELKHDVLPAGEMPDSTGVIVSFREALTIMAIMDDEELVKSLFSLMFNREDSTRNSGEQRE